MAASRSRANKAVGITGVLDLGMTEATPAHDSPLVWETPLLSLLASGAEAKGGISPGVFEDGIYFPSSV